MSALASPLPLFAMPWTASRPETLPSPSAPDERALCVAALKGDRPAFGALVALHQRAVMGLSLRLLGQREEAVDASQESFARAWASLGSYDPAQPFAPWLLRITRNHCTDLLRRRMSHGHHQSLDADADDDGPKRELVDERHVPADHAVDVARQSRKLEVAITALPERYRAVITLFHQQHRTYPEIAQILGVPQGTVMTWLHRARTQLRAALTETEATP